jgi:hypothetical protein
MSEPLTITVGVELGDELSVDAVDAVLRSVRISIPAGAILREDLSGPVAAHGAALGVVEDLQAEDPGPAAGVAGWCLAVRGLVEEDDGEGGLWVWDGSSTATVDGVTVLASATQTAGRWRRVTAVRPALPDGGVTTAKLGALAVDAEALADGAVGTDALAAGAVGGDALADGAVGAVALAADAKAALPLVAVSEWMTVGSFFSGDADGSWAHGRAAPLVAVEVWFRLGIAAGSWAAGQAVKAECFRGRSLNGLITSPGMELRSYDTIPAFSVAEVDTSTVRVRKEATLLSPDLSEVYLPDAAGSYKPVVASTATKLVQVNLSLAEIRIVARAR